VADPDGFGSEEALALLDWKRTIFALYADVRAAPDPAAAWRRWRTVRDHLFASHPQTPLPAGARAGFTALPCFDYDPTLRVSARVEAVSPRRDELPTGGKARIAFRRLAVAVFTLNDAEHRLDLHWLDAYGGGLFLPVADATNGEETYGGGRYLLDTVKGADLGVDAAGDLVLDFNFLFNPSCSYDEAWICPLPQSGNRLAVPLPGGERLA
jgi:uncharacterized protein (DUF1684 family)